MLSTVFFGFACLGLIGAVTTVARDHTYLAFIVTLVSFGVGLAALMQLWKRESSGFFAFAKQAKRDYGYQPPQYGYGQPPQYGGPPQYGQPPQFGQPPQDDPPGYGQPPADQ